MPTYGYRCPGCGHQYEKLQKMTDKTRAKCPNCGKRGERLISGGAGIVFKGSGFYITDYKRAGEAKPKGSDEPKEKTGESSEKKGTSSTSSSDKKTGTGDSA